MPGSRAPSSSLRADNTTCRCLMVSLTGPMVLPRKWGVTRVRGGFRYRASCLKARMNTHTVDIPASSRTLAVCPTDMWQTGQAATRRAASTFLDLISRARAGAASARSRR